MEMPSAITPNISYPMNILNMKTGVHIVLPFMGGKYWVIFKTMTIFHREWSGKKYFELKYILNTILNYITSL